MTALEGLYCELVRSHLDRAGRLREAWNLGPLATRLTPLPNESDPEQYDRILRDLRHWIGVEIHDRRGEVFASVATDFVIGLVDPPQD